MFTEPGTARQEAERLVAAALAFASLAANSHPELATGSPACCVCPFCKLIEAVRDPDPEVVERLATGAGDLAVGVAGLLRSLSGMTKPAPDPWRETSDGGSASGAARAAAPQTGPEAADTPAPPRKAVAKKALAPRPVPKNLPKDGTGWPAADAKPSGAADSSAEKPLAKKAVAKKAVKKAMPKPRPDVNG